MTFRPISFHNPVQRLISLLMAEVLSSNLSGADTFSSSFQEFARSSGLIDEAAPYLPYLVWIELPLRLRVLEAQCKQGRDCFSSLLYHDLMA